MGLTATSLEPPPQVNAVILQSCHHEYRSLDFGLFNPRVVLDGRNELDQAILERKGIRYLGIGR